MHIITNVFITLAVLLPFTSTTEHIVLEPYIPPEAPKITQVERNYSKPTPTPEQLFLIEKYAKIYNVDKQVMLDVISCESSFNETIQSRHRYKNGEQEMSFGLVQIHLPHHPNVTYEQAIDPEFAVNFLAENLSKGRGNMWTCYKQLASR